MLRSRLTLRGPEMLLLFVAYGVAFAALNRAALFWGTDHYYSLWFPAAGLRFSFLWLMGARVAPLLALAEIAGVWLTGGFLGQAHQLLFLAAVAAPSLGYGLAVAVVRRIHVRSAALSAETIRFGTAAIAAPFIGFLCNVPWHLLSGNDAFGTTRAGILANLIVFVIGDFLGIVVIAPPLLWALTAFRIRKSMQLGDLVIWLKSALIMAFGLAIVWAIYEAGFGIRLIPLALAVAAVGLSFGQVAAWGAVIIVAAAVVSLTAVGGGDGLDVPLHLQLAGISVIAFIAGSYADDKRAMEKRLRIREAERLHFERLRTLRAMSVAVIHELSQPLSTLSLETKYLSRLTKLPKSDPEELREVAELVAQKTDNLARMLRRLRSFGEAPGENPAPLPVEPLVREVVGVIAPEARAAGVRIEMKIRDRLSVRGYNVELQQALTNLLRNAVAASPNGVVELIATNAPDDHIRIDIVNTPTPNSPYRKGMGVGKLIVEAIAEMHGGSLIESEEENGKRRMSLLLPVARDGDAA